MKISITVNCPIEFQRIKNGERVIAEMGPAEVTAELLEGDIQGESPLTQVSDLLNKAAQDMRRAERKNRELGRKSSNPDEFK